MTFARVRDKISGTVADKTVKSYTLIKHRYELLAYVDEQGNEVEGPESSPEPQKKRSEVVRPAAPKLDQEQIAAKRAEMELLNQQAIEQAQSKAPVEIHDEPVTEELIEQESKPQPKKRGPKPKVK